MNFQVIQADFATFVGESAFGLIFGSYDELQADNEKCPNSDSEDFEEIGDIY